MHPMNKAIVILCLCGIGFSVWGIGNAIRLWANPIFGYFWVANNNVADILSYVGLGIEALLLASALIIYYQNTNRRTGMTCRFYPHKHLNVESYENYWQKNARAQAESDNVESQQLVIINGRRINLGSEVMEKIVN